MVIVGMDVHVRNSYIHATDVAGRLLRRGRCGNRLGELTEFLSSVEQATQAQGQPIHVVLESTTHSRAVQRMLTCYIPTSRAEASPTWGSRVDRPGAPQTVIEGRKVHSSVAG